VQLNTTSFHYHGSEVYVCYDGIAAVVKGKPFPQA